MRRETDELAVAEHPCLRSSQGLQPRQGGLGPLFLIEAERRVEQEDQADGGRFDRPGVRAFVQPEAEVEGEREQQDVDERALRTDARTGARADRERARAARSARRERVVRSLRRWKVRSSGRHVSGTS